MNFDDYITGEVRLEDLEFPSPIYKYRKWITKKHKTALTERKIKMSAPTSFDDKFDCKNHIRYDLLTPSQMFYIYLRDVIKKYPQLTNEQHHEIAKNAYYHSNLHDRRFMNEEAERDFIKFDQRMGICCLTANNSSMNMWDKYTSNYTGICIGYDPYVLFKFAGGGRIVEYVPELPIIMPTPWDDYLIQELKQIYFKLDEWAFEEEYRLQKWSNEIQTDETRIRILPPQAFKEIIFGYKMKKEAKEEIVAIKNDLMPNVELKIAAIENDKIIIKPYVE